VALSTVLELRWAIVGSHLLGLAHMRSNSTLAVARDRAPGGRHALGRADGGFNLSQLCPERAAYPPVQTRMVELKRPQIATEMTQISCLGRDSGVFKGSHSLGGTWTCAAGGGPVLAQNSSAAQALLRQTARYFPARFRVGIRVSGQDGWHLIPCHISYAGRSIS